MCRQNYDVSVATRIDQITKDKLDAIAAKKSLRISELLRETITEYLKKNGAAVEGGESSATAPEQVTDSSIAQASRPVTIGG